MNKTLKKLFADFTKNNGKKIFFTIIFGGIIMSILDIVNPFFYKEVISVIENFVKTGDFNQDLVIKIFLIWFLFIVFSTLFRAFIEYLLARANLKNHKLNHLKYSNKIFYLNYDEYLKQKSGTLFKIYDRGNEDSLEFIYILLSEIIVAVFSVSFLSVILFFINIKMALATLAFVPVVILIGVYFNLKTRKIQDKINDLRDDAFGILGDVLSNLALVKTLVLEKIFNKKFKEKVDYADKKQVKVAHRWIIADIYTKFIFLLARFSVLAVGIYEIKNGNLDIATLILFFTFVGSIYFPLGFIFGRLKILQRRLKGIENFYNKFESLNVEKQEHNKNNINFLDGNIEYKNVSFSYNKDKKILDDINFKINTGEKIALVGNTGAGKSTIVNLLFRFWELNSGEILLDSKNIKEIKKESLRKNIGYVMQDISLFNTTIRENLLFANQNASEEDLKQALKNAKAEFVFNLKNGLDTIIGERGLKLSGGEKQRIAIARLFLKNPKILVLDEATSALDNKTEKEIQNALDNLTKGKTTIIIAHRLSTIQNVDKIYMLENGKIIESGTYKELTNKKGKFYELANPEHLILN